MASTVASIIDSGNPSGHLETEYKIFLNSFDKYYIHQPNIMRWLMQRGHGTSFSIEHDERTVFEIPYLNDIETLDVSLDIPDKLIGFSATRFTATIAQIGGGWKLSEDQIRTTFNGQSKSSLVSLQIAEKMAQQEDILFINGKSSIGLQGVLDVATAITATGGWSVSSNGILTNAIKDIKQVNDAVLARGLAPGPIDAVVHPYLYNTLSHTIKTYGDMTGLDYLRPMLNGGDFFPSANVQSAITNQTVSFTGSTGTTTALFFYRTPKSFYRPGAKNVLWAIDKIGWWHQFNCKYRFGFGAPLGSWYMFKIENISTTATQ